MFLCVKDIPSVCNVKLLNIDNHTAFNTVKWHAELFWHFRLAWLCDMVSGHMAPCSGDLWLACHSMLAWCLAHVILFWVGDFGFVCSLWSRVGLGNHVPKGFYIVAAMPDIYPSDRNKHSQPLKTKSPAPWKQDKKEVTHFLNIYPFHTSFTAFFLPFSLWWCGEDVIGSRVCVWQCCLCLMFVLVLYTVQSVHFTPSLHVHSITIPVCLRFNLHNDLEV